MVSNCIKGLLLFHALMHFWTNSEISNVHIYKWRGGGGEGWGIGGSREGGAAAVKMTHCVPHMDSIAFIRAGVTFVRHALKTSLEPDDDTSFNWLPTLFNVVVVRLNRSRARPLSCLIKASIHRWRFHGRGGERDELTFFPAWPWNWIFCSSFPISVNSY